MREETDVDGGMHGLLAILLSAVRTRRETVHITMECEIEIRGVLALRFYSYLALLFYQYAIH